MRVILADDAVLFREGLARVLQESGFDVVGQVGSAAELLEQISARRADVAILDVRMPPTHTAEGLEAAVRLRAEAPDVGVLLLSQYVETRHVMRLIEKGARGVGYLLKDRVSDLGAFRSAVRMVGEGGSVIDPEVVDKLVARARSRRPLAELTEREREVLAMMAEGRSNFAIGDRLGLGQKTVEAHVRSIFSKLELDPAPDDNRRVLAVLAYLRL
jgi:DNA-binding NarL/FixJ family response regulator